MKKLSAISVPTYKFLTTGMCGCITTYSSWINDGINKEFDNSTWIRYLVMIMMEFWLTWGAFTMGYAFVKVVEESASLNFLYICASSVKGFATKNSPNLGLNAEARLQRAKLNDQVLLSDNTDEDAVTKANTRANSNSGTGVPGITPGVSGSPVPPVRSSLSGKRTTFSKSARRDSGLEAIDEVSEEGSERGPSSTYSSSQNNISRNRKTDIGLLLAEDAYESNEDNEDPATMNAISGRISVWRENGIKGEGFSIKINLKPSVTESSTSSTNAAPLPELTLLEKLLVFFQQYEFWIWCAIFWLVALPIWITLIAAPHISFFTNDQVHKNTFRAIALAPLGAWTRWGLTRFPKLKALYPEMNPQTMIANLVGVIFMCLLNLYSTDSWVAAINDGKFHLGMLRL
jgi:fluoride ion exporter CrcB/FEX